MPVSVRSGATPSNQPANILAGIFIHITNAAWTAEKQAGIELPCFFWYDLKAVTEEFDYPNQVFVRKGSHGCNP